MSAYEDWEGANVAAPYEPVNRNWRALGNAFLFAHAAALDSGLDVGIGGGDFDDGTALIDQVLTCTDDDVNYIVAERADGTLSVSTATTNWDDTTTYGRVGIATFADGVLTYQDQRFVDGGIFRGASGGGTSSWKQAARAASTASVTLASAVENGDTLDGVTLATGDRILLKNQSTASENGIYVVAASGAPTRASDANSGAELVNASVYVSEGTTNADSAWVCTTNAPITVGSTALTWAQFNGGGGITALTGDVTASGPGSAAATLANSGVSAGTYSRVTVDAKGRATAGVDMATVTALSISSGVVNIDCALGDYFTLALNANVTSITFSNLPGSGKGATKWVQITQDSTPRTVAWPASFRWAGGVAGSVSTGSGAVDELAITTVDNGATWKASLGGAFA